MRLKDTRLWQICLVLAVLPLARFGYTMSLFSTAGYTGTIIIVDASTERPIEGAILVFTYIEAGGFTAPFGYRENPSDAQGVVGPIGYSNLANYHFTVTAAGYTSAESFISIDGVENEKTVEMYPIDTPDPYTDPSNPSPDLGYTLSWLDGVSLVFGLCTVGLYLKKPDATIDELTSLRA